MKIFSIKHTPGSYGEQISCRHCGTELSGERVDISLVKENKDALAPPFCAECCRESGKIFNVVQWPDPYDDLSISWQPGMNEADYFDGYRCSGCYASMYSLRLNHRKVIQVPCNSSELFWILYAAAKHCYLYEDLAPVLDSLLFSDGGKIVFEYLENKFKRPKEIARVHRYLNLCVFAYHKPGPYSRLRTGTALWIRSKLPRSTLVPVVNHKNWAWYKTHSQTNAQTFLQNHYAQLNQEPPFEVQPTKVNKGKRKGHHDVASFRLPNHRR